MGFFDDLFAMTAKQIEAWSPKGCKTEKDFENSLYRHLPAALPDTQVTKQYSVGRAKADIAVGSPVEVIVEIKKDLTSTGQMQRLMGQLGEYEKWKGRIIVLLIGETEPNLMKQLQARAKSNQETFFFENQLVIIWKE